jgi:hypothetical protein
MIRIFNPPDGEEFDGQAWTRWFYQLVAAFNSITETGTTAQRPSPAPFPGFMYFDSTLGKPVWAKTLTQYVDATGLNV